MDARPPESLYKFRAWDDYGKSAIVNREIYFSSPADLNDPFDCRIPVRYDKMSDSEYRQYLQFIIRANHPSNSDQEIEKITDEFLEKIPERTPENIFRISKISFPYIAETYGVYSLTRNKDRHLLWSHYADSHKGFCIEWNGEQLLEYLYSLFESNGIPIYFHAVEYSDNDDIPIIIPPLEPGYENHFQKIMINKSKVWRYEKEYRFILIGKSKHIEPHIPESCYSKIYIGCNMPVETEQEVRKAVSEHLSNVPIIKVIRNLETYKLNFHDE